MSDIRLSALEHLRGTKHVNGEQKNDNKRISEIFGQNVFGLRSMKEYITERSYYAILSAIRQNRVLDMGTAEDVAKGMKKWAMDRGVTHYTHWFQPLTGTTAEKHDAFYKPSLDEERSGIENLTGRELIQREPDASSFPSGGLRNTAEARGYTVWDPTSPAFIMEIESGKTLYVPAVFISYTGEALDYKAPLLKSIDALNHAAVQVCQYFDRSIKNVYPTLGWEQEYFIVDELLFEARPDLMMAGRTLFGSKSAKGQEMEDHYFASIPERVQIFMTDFEKESLKLGIPILTRHNEVAPGQYECAPMFEELNVAVDHNLLIMEVMNRVASRHGLRVLFHEKPFAGVNGSGKHNNWSMATDTGKNLLNPGDEPAQNLQFLTFFVVVIKAIDEYSEVLRASIASANNDHRLGANEAPPAIISVFTGSLMERILKEFKEKGLAMDKSLHTNVMELNIPKIPEALLDNTDRNRTSPFPFTGNKFEFRAVGSSANCSQSMTTLNAMVADQLVAFKKEVDNLINGGKETEQAIVEVLQRYIKESEKRIFNGHGYTEEWEQEAERRGLANVKTTPFALDALVTQKAKDLFERHNILSARETEARYEVFQEQFAKIMERETHLIEELAQTHILPAAIEYTKKLADAYQGYAAMGLDAAAQTTKAMAHEIGDCVQGIQDALQHMKVARDAANAKGHADAVSKSYLENVKPYFEQIREKSDTLELLVDDSAWRLPKYRELLFLK